MEKLKNSNFFLPPCSQNFLQSGLFLRAGFGSQQNWGEGAEVRHTLTHTLSMIMISCRSGTFVTTDQPTPTHHSHPKSTLYTRAHSWCTFCVLGQTRSDRDLSLGNIQSTPAALQTLCAPPVHPICTPPPASAQPLATTDLFTDSIVVTFPVHTTVYLDIHLLKGILAVSKVEQLLSEAAINTLEQVFVQT